MENERKMLRKELKIEAYKRMRNNSEGKTNKY